MEEIVQSRTESKLIPIQVSIITNDSLEVFDHLETGAEELNNGVDETVRCRVVLQIEVLVRKDFKMYLMGMLPVHGYYPSCCLRIDSWQRSSSLFQISS